jgi:hypothetical protein
VENGKKEFQDKNKPYNRYNYGRADRMNGAPALLAILPVAGSFDILVATESFKCF